MGCRNDYLEPIQLEKHSKLTASLLMYATNALMIQGASNVSPLEDWVEAASVNIYGNKERADDLTASLCGLINGMTEDQRTAIIYDGRNSVARDLAKWWEDHQRVDRERDLAWAKETRLREVATRIIDLLNDEGKEALRWAAANGLLK